MNLVRVDQEVHRRVFLREYRTLARAYHPDHNPGQGVRERELWYEIQEAYGEGDLRRLEALWAMAKADAQESLEDERVSVILDLVCRVKGALRAVESETRRGRKDPAWRFSEKLRRRGDAERIRREYEWAHEHALRKLRLEIEEQMDLIAEWREMGAREGCGAKLRL